MVHSHGSCCSTLFGKDVFSFNDIPISLLSQLERPLLIQEVIQFVGHPCLHVNIVSVLYTLKLVFRINKQTCKAVHLHVIGTFF